MLKIYLCNPSNTQSASHNVISLSYPRNLLVSSRLLIFNLTSVPRMYLPKSSLHITHFITACRKKIENARALTWVSCRHIQTCDRNQYKDHLQPHDIFCPQLFCPRDSLYLSAYNSCNIILSQHRNLTSTAVLLLIQPHEGSKCLLIRSRCWLWVLLAHRTCPPGAGTKCYARGQSHNLGTSLQKGGSQVEKHGLKS